MSPSASNDLCVALLCSNQAYDLSKDVPCLVVTDCIVSSYDPKKDGPGREKHIDNKQVIALRNSLITRVSSTGLPALAITTGGTSHEHIDYQADNGQSLFRALDMMGNGCVAQPPHLHAHLIRATARATHSLIVTQDPGAISRRG